MNRHKKQQETDHIVKDHYQESKKYCKDIQIDYKQKGNVFKHPARILIIGPAGSGKTNLITDIVMYLLSFRKLYIFAKNTEQQLFEYLYEYINKQCKTARCPIDDLFYMNNEIDIKIDSKNEEGEPIFNPKYQSLVIFDDMTHKSDTKNSSLVSQYLKYGRPANASVIVATQNFFDTSKNVRENVNYICLFRGKDPNDINALRKFYASELVRGEFDEIYHRATEKEYENDRNAFLYIDCNQLDKGLKYRRGFVAYSLFPRNDNRTLVEKYGPITKHPRNYTRKYHYDSDSD